MRMRMRMPPQQEQQQLARSLVASFLTLLFIVDVMVLAFASWGLDRGGADSAAVSVRYSLALVSLIAGVVGMASILVGCHHVHVWRGESGVAAASVALVAWLLTLLGFGIACKAINASGTYDARWGTLEAFVIILALFQLIYLCLLHAGLFIKNYGPCYYNYVVEPPPTSYGPQMVDVKQVKTTTQST